MTEKSPLRLTPEDEARVDLLGGDNQIMSQHQALEATVGKNRARSISGFRHGRTALNKLEESAEKRRLTEKAAAEARTEQTIQLLHETDPRNL